MRRPGCRTLITHLFDAASPYLEVEAVFGVRSSLILDMSTAHAHFDFTLDALN